MEYPTTLWNQKRGGGGPKVGGIYKPAPKSAKKSQQIGEQIGRPIFRQNRFPVTWISVPGPKHTFLLVAQLLESCGNPAYVSIFKKNFVSRSAHGP